MHCWFCICSGGSSFDLKARTNDFYLNFIFLLKMRQLKILSVCIEIYSSKFKSISIISFVTSFINHYSNWKRLKWYNIINNKTNEKQNQKLEIFFYCKFLKSQNQVFKNKNKLNDVFTWPSKTVLVDCFDFKKFK